MALIDIDKFVASIMYRWNNSEMKTIFNDMKYSLIDQGLEYKDNKIVKSQRRVSAEAKETGYSENENERIRKVLVELVKCNERCGYFMINNITTSSMLAWLEKQGEQKSIWHNEDEEPQRGSLILLVMQSGTPIVAKIIEPNHTFNHGERWAYIDDLLEKQGKSLKAQKGK